MGAVPANAISRDISSLVSAPITGNTEESMLLRALQLFSCTMSV